MNEKITKYPHGTVKAVSDRTGISRTVVSDVLKYDKGSRRKVEILQATAEYVNEVQTKEREARDRLNAALNQAQA